MFGHQSNDAADDHNEHKDNTAMMPEPKSDGVLGAAGSPLGQPPAVDDKPAGAPPAAGPHLPASDQPAHPHHDDFSHASSSADDLLDLKKEALEQLSPLVSHLDQTPEEKFHTTMMMIQATDNQSLVKKAYEAAGQIHDEKARAQALLDIVNEINYFTQKDKTTKEI